MKNPGTDLEKRAKNGTAAVSESPKAALSSILVKSFHYTGKRLYLGNFVQQFPSLQITMSATKSYSSALLGPT